ncbi:MAG TPA: hypothetical protein PK636_07940, partial [bacterium]|nr:hypothetical protein [bacterium]
MKRILGSVCLAAALFLPVAGAWSQVEAGLGAGVFYNKMLGSIENDDWKIDEDYLSYLVSLRVQFLTFLGAEAILNYYPGSGSIDYQVTPMGTAILNLLGDLVNVGVGINKTYIKYDDPLGGSDGEWSDLSYHFKAGVQLPL